MFNWLTVQNSWRCRARNHDCRNHVFGSGSRWSGTSVRHSITAAVYVSDGTSYNFVNAFTIVVEILRKSHRSFNLTRRQCTQYTCRCIRVGWQQHAEQLDRIYGSRWRVDAISDAPSCLGRHLYSFSAFERLQAHPPIRFHWYAAEHCIHRDYQDAYRTNASRGSSTAFNENFNYTSLAIMRPVL